MNAYEANRNWSDRFIPHIKQLVGPHLLDTAPILEDQQRNTDLIVLRMRDTRIACRVRKAGYASRYPCDITLRATTPSGGRTELRKVIEGWGDLMFYGFAADDYSDQIDRWILGDLNAFRGWVHFEVVRLGVMPGVLKDNGDGTTFRAFNYRDIPNFVLASSDVGVGTLF